MDNILFNLKFTVKSFERASKKSEKQIEAEKKKVKEALKKGNIDGARIYSQNAIRKKNESLNYLRLAARLDGVAARVDTAIKMNQVNSAMSGVVKGMDKVLGSMDVNKIAQVMDKFEQQFGNLDVATEYMEGAMGAATSLSTPEDQVNQLMAEVADEHGLEINDSLGGIKTGKADLDSVYKSDLTERLKKLKSAEM
ncbi:vacuolar protein sorting protein VPS46 [Acrasis kona]|uniref:Vacuolar protein sorting protein VPS46 n=1 Tax=Acrasis kona TaxID=1008807 RepID=A0AAW2ZPD1_9EUKA